MKKGIIQAAVAIAAALLTVGFAAAAGSPRLLTFGTGDVFVNGAKFATFNDANEYGGVYRNHTSNALLTDSRIDLESSMTARSAAGRLGSASRSTRTTTSRWTPTRSSM